jgi:hypothetical protein
VCGRLLTAPEKRHAEFCRSVSPFLMLEFFDLSSTAFWRFFAVEKY